MRGLGEELTQAVETEGVFGTGPGTGQVGPRRDDNVGDGRGTGDGATVAPATTLGAGGASSHGGTDNVGAGATVGEGLLSTGV